MFDRLARSIAISLLLVPAASAGATLTIFRCASADGAISLQDRPCPDDADQSQRRVRRERDAPATAPVAPAAATEDVAEPPIELPAPRALPPPLWLCVDFDGSQRESSDGQPRGRYVPLWVVGRDPDAPAQVFGRVGNRPALPAVRPPAGARSRTATGTQPAPQVWVAERCYTLGPAAACERYAEQRRELERRIFNAQPSERALLAPQSEALRRILSESCS